MTRKTIATSAAALAALATAGTAPAAAQMEQQAPQQQAAPQQMAPATDVSQAEVDKFAQVYIFAAQLSQQENAPSPEQQQQAVLGALQEVDLEPRRYVQIAQTAGNDEALSQRISQSVQALVAQAGEG